MLTPCYIPANKGSESTAWQVGTTMSSQKDVTAVGGESAQTEATQETSKQAYQRLLASVRTKSSGVGLPMADIHRAMHAVFDEVGDELVLSVLKEVVVLKLRKEFENDAAMMSRLEHDVEKGNVYRKIYSSCTKPSKALGWKFEVKSGDDGSTTVRRHH